MKNETPFDAWMALEEIFPVNYEKRDEEEAEIVRLLGEERY